MYKKNTKNYDSSSIGGSDSEAGAKVFKDWQKDAAGCTGLQVMLAGVSDGLSLNAEDF